jgi:UDPglucose 6-dehydrogenase
MNVAIVGTGYVGLVAGVCFADAGHNVWGVDRDEKKIASLKQMEVPIYEPGLSDVFERSASRLTFTTDLALAVDKCDVIFVAVGTPETEDGSADMRPTMAVVEAVAQLAKTPKYLVLKSTVPVGTAKKVRAKIKETTKVEIEVISNPEFLKEGAAVEDFLKPDRVVIGCKSPKAEAVMRELYEPFVKNGNPILFMDNVSAEMTKYAANAFLSVKISFINELALLADELGADINDVRRGFTSDSRINPAFFYPGVGFGGSCFPKDVKALIHSGRDVGVAMQVVESADAVNDRQKLILFDRLKNYFESRGESLKGKRIAMWGLAFKPRTDDVREAPAMYIIEKLVDAGATVVGFDPVAMDTASASFTRPFIRAGSAMDAAKGADALAIVTEWNEFRTPDLPMLKSLLKRPAIFDGRNVLDPAKVSAAGFDYFCIGRQSRSLAKLVSSGDLKLGSSQSGKSALVAGAAGFVGSHLVDSLLEQGYSVIGVDSFITGREENLAAALRHPKFKFVKHDIRQPINSALKTLGIEVKPGLFNEIYNLASPASPVDFDKIPLAILETAATGHRYLLDLARDVKAVCLFASSSEVYGDAEVHPQVESYFGNVNTVGHRSCYDEAKRYGEALSVAHAKEFGTQVRMARIFNTYGPRMRPTDGRIIPNFFMQAMQGRALTVYGEGTQTRSFCFVSDLVSGLIALARSGESRPTNLGNPIERSVSEIAKNVCQLTGSKSGVTHLPLPENDPKVRRPNIDRAKGFGWTPKVTLEDGLSASMEYFRQQLTAAGGNIATPTVGAQP